MKYDLEAIIYEELVLELSNRGLLDEGFMDKAKKLASTAALGGALALGMGGSAQAANVKAKPAATQTIQADTKFEAGFAIDYLNRYGKLDPSNIDLQKEIAQAQLAIVGKVDVSNLSPKAKIMYDTSIKTGKKAYEDYKANDDKDLAKSAERGLSTTIGNTKLANYLEENTMQIQVTKARLQEMINEELKKVLKEEYRPEDNYASPPPPRTAMYKAKKKIGGAVKSAGQMVGRNLGKLGAAAALGGAMAAAPTAFDKGMDYLERDRAEQTSRMADYEGSMDVNVSDAVESLYSYPEFTDKTTLQAAVETVLADNLEATYENVFPEYERILGSSMKESKRNLSLEDLIIKELAKMSIT